MAQLYPKQAHSFVQLSFDGFLHGTVDYWRDRSDRLFGLLIERRNRYNAERKARAMVEHDLALTRAELVREREAHRLIVEERDRLKAERSAPNGPAVECEALTPDAQHLRAALQIARVQHEELLQEYAAYKQRMSKLAPKPNLTLAAEVQLLRIELDRVRRERDAYGLGATTRKGAFWFVHGDSARTALVEGERMRATI